MRSSSRFRLVSIGRRLIDPMAEYVKIEPKHLGMGMYQVGLHCNSNARPVREEEYAGGALVVFDIFP